MMRAFYKTLCLALAALLLTGCLSPLGAKRNPTKAVYAQMEANALSAGQPSADTLSLLHRYGIEWPPGEPAEEAVQKLHAKALATGERELLFALAEVSFLTGEKVRKSTKVWDKRDQRDYYLGAAVYAYLYLFEGKTNQSPGAFDRHFRSACDLYNYGLGLSLVHPKDTNGIVQWPGGPRRLPVGNIEIQLDASTFPWPLENFDAFVLADQFLVRGFTERIRQAGVGAPLIAVYQRTNEVALKTTTPVTAFLRIDGNLKEISEGGRQGRVELYSAFGEGTVQVARQSVPLETDLTVHMAYGLNQTLAWELDRLQFMSLREVIPNGVYLSQPYERGRIPVVFVHGTFSSPIWWAPMLNALRADPELRKRYQFWYFIYNSSAPVLVSGAKLRQALSDRLKELDPEGADAALQQMVVIGHSQGGLLAKLTVTETGGAVWNSVSEKSVDALDLKPTSKDLIRQFFYVEPLPFVRRVVFISTPHRGSYRAAGLIQRLARWAVSIPANLTERATEMGKFMTQLKLPEGMGRRKITAVDSMSPKNKALLALAELPVTPAAKAHSIIPVSGKKDFRLGGDGVVKYSSAHLDGMESELVVPHRHSCQDKPDVIEEVRRILHVHLDAQPGAPAQKTSGE